MQSTFRHTCFARSTLALPGSRSRLIALFMRARQCSQKFIVFYHLYAGYGIWNHRFELQVKELRFTFYFKCNNDRDAWKFLFENLRAFCLQNFAREINFFENRSSLFRGSSVKRAVIIGDFKAWHLLVLQGKRRVAKLHVVDRVAAVIRLPRR